ncbi:MAG: NAD-dependent epimerase/dehydratase family protein [Candidatus Dormibacteraeota bacterium]|uniref:NAD-dependent epimerase/dehydratase family protein n=1 Tax=Candidatus Aeolococcus gillhamiae TaxID=3127015 RepID=A0A934JPQ6_9BACT|nr:NAD-dependent epimerase/dehydratase family protein [Candidatus Dormibacteraeota bacterium]
MAQGRRILVTGVSRFWGAELARRLEADPGVEQIVAVDTEGPIRQLARTDFVRADIRHSLVGKLIRGLGIDTVVHAGLIVDPQQAGGRTVHETNVIGTMNLIAACSGADSPVRQLIVKSSTAVYGSEPDDPSFWTEDMRRRGPARDGFTGDLDEVESYVRDYEMRHPDVAVTLLRFGNVLGDVLDSPFARLFDRAVVPTVFGFDPRLQFLDEDDAIAALTHATLNKCRGTYNVAGAGVVVLSQAIALMGKINAPVIPFVGGTMALRFLERFGLVDFPPEFVRLLQHGRVVDTTRLHVELGFHPQRTTMEAVAAHGRQRRARGVLDAEAPYRYEAELEEFLRSRGQRDEPASTNANGRRSRRRRTTTVATASAAKRTARRTSKPASASRKATAPRQAPTRRKPSTTPRKSSARPRRARSAPDADASA